MKINIRIGPLTLEAELNETATAKAVANVLPLTTSFNTWGDEIYFSIPVEVELDESAKEEVQIGDLGYWPTGRAFCIFFGPTPVSTDEQPRAASPVNILGRVLGDATQFRAVPGGTQVQITRAMED